MSFNYQTNILCRNTPASLAYIKSLERLNTYMYDFDTDTFNKRMKKFCSEKKGDRQQVFSLWNVYFCISDILE